MAAAERAAASGPPPSACPEPQGSGPATVADVVAERGAVECPRSQTLQEVAKLLVTHDRTAALVLDERGSLAGVLTENDILHAHSIGVPWHYSVEAWLLGDCARLPGFLAPALAVRPGATLPEAAAQMRAQATGEFACRHLLVKAEGEPPRGVLSSLDFARALCAAGAEQPEAAKRLGSKIVAEVMKPRGAMPVCGKGATLAKALEEMIVARQNCALVIGAEAADSIDGPVLGVITTRDALRAFSEQVDGKAPVAEWLQVWDAGSWGSRVVQADASLRDAAALMARSSLHHLVVVSPASSEIVGVVSSSDLAYALASEAGTA